MHTMAHNINTWSTSPIKFGSYSDEGQKRLFSLWIVGWNQREIKLSSELEIERKNVIIQTVSNCKIELRRIFRAIAGFPTLCVNCTEHNNQHNRYRKYNVQFHLDLKALQYYSNQQAVFSIYSPKWRYITHSILYVVITPFSNYYLPKKPVALEADNASATICSL